MGPKKRGGLVGAAPKRTGIQRQASDLQQHSTPRPLIPVQVPDSWTDEQEITLFRAITKWKPAGMHKHFRMLSIAQLMKNHGVADSHTNIEGIWKKLASLYLLEAVDDQEEMPDEGYESPTPFTDFDLPEDEFGELKLARRLNPEGTESPPAESPVKPTKAATRGKAGTAKAKKETQAEAPVAGTTRRGTKRRKPDETPEEVDEAADNAANEESGEEQAAPAPTAKRRGRSAKSAEAGTAKSTPAPEHDDGHDKEDEKAEVEVKPKGKPQAKKRGRPTRQQEPEPEPEQESESEDQDDDDEEGEKDEEEEDENDSEVEGTGESDADETVASPTSNRRSRSTVSTRAAPKGKKGKAKGETVRRSTRKK